MQLSSSSKYVLHISASVPVIARHLGISTNCGLSSTVPKVMFQTKRHFSDQWDYDIDKFLVDDKFAEFSDRMFRLPQHGHNVLVIQPYVRDLRKTAPKIEENMNTTPQLQLEEAVALIRTLPRWAVIDKLIIGVPNYNKTSFFGTGQIEKLKEIVNKDRNISAIFVSVNILRVKQIIALELALNVPIFDRYTVVIQIFRQHAITKESKLQVAMAEIPYLRQCIKGFPKGLSDRLASGGLIGGTGSLFIETRKELLNRRESNLNKAIENLRKHRQRLRNNKKLDSYVTIAVVGYTNAGKTSLIKALTGAEKLQPRNQLFATLDVTKHEGILPCNLKVLYIDTVGFITDIPTDLLESFTATLEDAMYSDVIIHVWDVSNPDALKQREHVLETLEKMKFGGNLAGKLFEVGNKVDRISKDALFELQRVEPHPFLVSTKTGFGMQEMLNCLQKHVLTNSRLIRMKIRVKIAGEEYNWLHQEVAIEDMALENDNERILLTVFMTKDQLDIFKHKFIS